MMNMTETVKQLIIINIIFFIGSNIVGQSAVDYLALHSPTSDMFKFWQPISHMFMHGSIMHIFFNMFALLSFGSLLESLWGPKKFLFFYFSCGLGAAALHLGVGYFEMHSILEQVSYVEFSDDTIRQMLNVPISQNGFIRKDFYLEGIKPIVEQAGKLQVFDQAAFEAYCRAAILNQTPSLGASGAIYGIMVAFAFLFPNAELMMLFIPIPIKAKYFVPLLVGLDIYLGVTGKSLFGSGAGIAHFAHVGGALVGFIMMWYWKKNQFNNRRWD